MQEGRGKNCGAGIGPSRPRATGNRSRATENLAKSRTIDLRLSDKLMSDGRWSTIKSIEADQQNWITYVRATALQDNDGYAYLLQGENAHAGRIAEGKSCVTKPRAA